MTGEERAVVARARACLGVRFRLHGRGREGLDCVGLAAHAYRRGDTPCGYALRGGDPAQIAATIDTLGLDRTDGPERPADLLLLATGPHQLHLAIRTDRGFIHADAGLRRVTEVPGSPPWPVLARWRATPKGS
jgi:murein DD-endopeptidase / murein LD-carboxypeptidase